MNNSSRASRNSNLELMRIVLMLLIISHHFVVNSGVNLLWTSNTLNAKAAFLTFYGMWGKVAINAFVMVTGWFMCQSRLTWRKYARLLTQVYFWKLTIWFFLCIVGAQGITPRAVILNLVAPFRGVDSGFTSSFLAMYLMIPFLNKLISALDRGLHLRLLATLFGIYTVTTTFLLSETAFSELGWYCTLYLSAAYLRMYRPEWSSNNRRVGRLLLISTGLSIGSVAASMFLGVAFGIENSHPYFFVNDSGKLLALTTGTLCFLWFEGIEMPNSQVVNLISSTTFGVLLIHAHSDVMRTWLWKTVFNVPDLYVRCTFLELAVRSVLVSFLVFACCSVLDLLRQRAIEPSIERWFNGNGEKIEEVALQLWKHVQHLVG